MNIANFSSDQEHLHNLNLNTEQDLGEYLVIARLIDQETDKPDEEMDIALLDECFAYMEELVVADAMPDDEALRAKLQAITAISGETTSTAEVTSCCDLPRRRHLRRSFKILIAAAAILTLLVGTFTIAAKTKGCRNALELVYQTIVEIFDLESGERLHEENFSLAFDDNIEQYSSIEELAAAKNTEVLFPSTLPTDVELLFIKEVIRNNDQYLFICTFNTADVSLIIRNDYVVDVFSEEELTLYETDVCNFYIKPLKDGSYQAITNYNGSCYILSCNEYDSLILMLDSMKGYQP